MYKDTEKHYPTNLDLFLSTSRSIKKNHKVIMTCFLHLSFWHYSFLRALSKFEESDFPSVRNHLKLIPGAALNSLTENLTKSAWSVKLNHPDMTFAPVWAPEKIEQTAELSLIQAETLFFTSGSPKAKSKDNNTKDQKIM